MYLSIGKHKHQQQVFFLEIFGIGIEEKESRNEIFGIFGNSDLLFFGLFWSGLQKLMIMQKKRTFLGYL